jgi:diguanylate cyclase (GGDEF)-like protein
MTTPSELDSPILQPFPNFHSATSAVLKFLQSHLGFDLCMVTRVKGSQWIVVNVEDRRYGIKAGAVFPWTDTLCYPMVMGQGGNITPDVSAVAAYAKAPLSQQFNIGAYVSLPLFHSDGSLFGTLCAFHPEVKPLGMDAQKSLLKLLVQLLVSQLDSDLKLLQQKRQMERAQAERWCDELTGLYNRQAWDHFLTVEDSRCHRYGRDACVVSLKFDLAAAEATQGASSGEPWMTAIAHLLRSLLREEDVLARVEANQIAIIAVETQPERLLRLVNRLQSELSVTAFPIALGSAVREPSASLTAAWHQAQATMAEISGGTRQSSYAA